MQGRTSQRHSFFDRGYVLDWAEEANRKRPGRQAVFDLFCLRLRAASGGRALRVLEIGSGPGFLAEAVLGSVPIETYYLLDYSPHMHALAAERLSSFAEKIVLIQADIREPIEVAGEIDAVISIQAIHELRDASLIPPFYEELARLMIPGGLFLVCDHVNGDHAHLPHLLTVAEHAAALRAVGCDPVEVLDDDEDLAVLVARLADASRQLAN